ncbi:MAG: pilus assembly protein [Bryobacteraceae bacterium]|nr:pilus assembly protein [Bryobacteraceae bacterium]
MNRRKGNALLETALAFPVLVVIIMGVFDYGRIFSTNLLAGNAARAGAQVVILNPERFAGSDWSAAIGEVESAIEAQDPGTRKQVLVERFSECANTQTEQAYPASCPGAASYVRVRVTLPMNPMFRYPAGAFPAHVGEAAVVRIN